MVLLLLLLLFSLWQLPPALLGSLLLLRCLQLRLRLWLLSQLLLLWLLRLWRVLAGDHSCRASSSSNKQLQILLRALLLLLLCLFVPPLQQRMLQDCIQIPSCDCSLQCSFGSSS
jgi:hypothetical protein